VPLPDTQWNITARDFLLMLNRTDVLYAA
jgi:hypothetical protein